METNEKQVSNNIKALLKRYDISRENLAEKLGITKRTLIKVVNHPFRYNVDYLNKVASIIGCNINDFFMPL
jgi:transcriptional regulator with XRE-family HTH domain